ncbi:hypothetical protein WME75_46315 [Sorangium sp. So ce1014]|uniref:hypothetical protein n=1 Tax=Sorangium sp. So ce1014 TaxID=3133326 RepID=UPI003F5EA54B
MKKIARWALAFATVMSVSGSAMAMHPVYKVFVARGGVEKPAGHWVNMFLEEDSGYDLGCVYKTRWANSLPGVYSTSTTLSVIEHMSSSQFLNCNEYGADLQSVSMISLIDGNGFDANGQLKKLFHLVVALDEYGTGKGLCKFTPFGFAQQLSLKAI